MTPQTLPPVDILLFSDKEAAFYAYLMKVYAEVVAVANLDQNYLRAMELASHIAEPLGEFMDSTMINDPDTQIKANRLHLMQIAHKICTCVADFSLIKGKK